MYRRIRDLRQDKVILQTQMKRFSIAVREFTATMGEEGQIFRHRC